ncbi:MAG: CAP domain-containing protein [Chloroflexota bacterium]
MRRRPSAPRPSLRAILASTTLALVVASGLGPFQPADPAAAGTAETMEASILGWVNDARAQRGLAALRPDSRLIDLAGDRAATLAAKDQLSHDAAGCLSCQLEARGIAWNLYGEVLASNSWPWGSESARVVFESWRDSPSHWDILMNPQYDSVGVGVGLSASGTTYASAVLIDAPVLAAQATPKPTPGPKPAPTPPPTPPPTLPPSAAPRPRPVVAPTRQALAAETPDSTPSPGRCTRAGSHPN